MKTNKKLQLPSTQRKAFESQFIQWNPKPDSMIPGRITKSVFTPCYCHETTKTGKPKLSCRKCKGKGGTTDIWVEPLLIKMSA